MKERLQDLLSEVVNPETLREKEYHSAGYLSAYTHDAQALAHPDTCTRFSRKVLGFP